MIDVMSSNKQYLKVHTKLSTFKLKLISILIKFNYLIKPRCRLHLISSYIHRNRLKAPNIENLFLCGYILSYNNYIGYTFLYFINLNCSFLPWIELNSLYYSRNRVYLRVYIHGMFTYLVKLLLN